MFLIRWIIPKFLQDSCRHPAARIRRSHPCHSLNRNPSKLPALESVVSNRITALTRINIHYVFDIL